MNGSDDARATSAELPTARGLWYRVHPAAGLALDQGKARSRPVETPGIGQAGLSAFASPHHLYSYINEMGWGGRDWLHGYDGITPRRVVAFHGREIGRGDDDEPLIRPEASSGCCGQIVHSHMAWSTFVRKLSGTPRPRTKWTPDGARDTGSQRTAGTRGQREPASARDAVQQAGADYPGPVQPPPVIQSGHLRSASRRRGTGETRQGVRALRTPHALAAQSFPHGPTAGLRPGSGAGTPSGQSDHSAARWQPAQSLRAARRRGR